MHLYRRTAKAARLDGVISATHEDYTPLFQGQISMHRMIQDGETRIPGISIGYEDGEVVLGKDVAFWWRQNENKFMDPQCAANMQLVLMRIMKLEAIKKGQKVDGAMQAIYKDAAWRDYIEVFKCIVDDVHPFYQEQCLGYFIKGTGVIYAS